jgi:hypothetical protein
MKTQFKNGQRSWVWWYTAVIPAHGRLRQEDHEFKGRNTQEDPVSKQTKNVKKMDEGSEHTPL